jgi:hypothetical protein
MKYLSSLLCILLSINSLTGFSQTAAPATGYNAAARVCSAFSGRVLAGGKPLAGVSLAVKGTITILITNEEGFFTLPATGAGFPTLTVSAAGYGPQVLTLTSCTPVTLELELLPGTRIKKHGKRKGFIMKTGA